jgi:hypothetical protein
MKTTVSQTDEDDQTILDINESCLILEALVNEYRKAILWLSYGNHDPSPSIEETKQLLTRLNHK